MRARKPVPVFQVIVLGEDGSEKSYPVTADAWTTFDNVWRSQKCWFSSGTRVTIQDMHGIRREYTKE